MCKLAGVIRYTVLSQHFHFLLFSSDGLYKTVKLSAVCLDNICGFIT